MKNLKSVKYIIAFGVFLCAVLILIQLMDESVALNDDGRLHIPTNEIDSYYGDAKFRLKSSDDPEWIDYTFNVSKSDLDTLTSDEKYLVLGYLSDNAYRVYFNEHYIGTVGDFLNGLSDTSKISHVFTIPESEIIEDNTFHIRARSVLGTGFLGSVQIVDEVTRLKITKFINFDRQITSFVVYGTLLLGIVMIFISMLLIRVRDKRYGTAYIYLSAAVILMSIYATELLGVNYYVFSFEWFYKMKRLLIFAAALCMLFATGFFKRRLHIKLFGPLIALSIVGITFLTRTVTGYEYSAVGIMGVMIGLNVYSVILLTKSTEDEKLRNYALGICTTIVMTVIVHYLPSFIVSRRDLSITTIGIAPLCMFWFFLSYMIVTELLEARRRETKEAEVLKLQQEHVFNNMGEGFFRVDQNGIIINVLTQVCNTIFGRDIKGVELGELICETDEDKEFLTELLGNYFKKKIAASVCFELFPDELKINDKYFKLTYEPEKKDNEIVALVVVMSDVTETKVYEMTMITEKQKLKMVVSTMLNRDDLIELLNEFIEFTGDVMEDIYDDLELMNKIHTFKGNFGMYNLMHIVPFLHDLEDQLIAGKTIAQDIGNEMRNTIYEDLEIVTEITGSSFFEDEVYLSVNKNNLEKVYQTVRRHFYDQEASLILNIMEQIFYKSVGDVLMFYAKESVKIASRKGKTINIATLSGDEVFIDTFFYRDVFRALVHLFNNCIEHGIEEEEERMMIGKSPYGELACSIDDLGNLFEVTISDDGRGIDLGKVRNKAINKEIITTEQADAMTEEELMLLIFEPNFSTKSYADDISGRGVGMAAVKAEVERIGGTVRVESIMDFGTTVKLLLPKNQAKFIKFFSLPIVLDLYVESCKIYLKSNNVIDLPLSVAGVNRGVELFDLTVIIPFKGPKTGAFYLSGNRTFVKAMSRAMLELEHVEDVTDELYDEVSLEVMKESCNIIAGNAISLFDVEGNIADIGIPEIIDENHEIHDYNILTWSLEYDGANFCLGIVSGYEGEVVDMDELLNS